MTASEKAKQLIERFNRALADYNEYTHGGHAEILKATLSPNGVVTLEFFDETRNMQFMEALNYLEGELEELRYELG